MHHDSFGTTVNRILSWGIPVGLTCTLLAHAWGMSLWLGALSGLLAWAGACIGHGSFQNPSEASYKKMSWYCVLLLFLILLPFYLDTALDLVDGVRISAGRAMFLIVLFPCFTGAHLACVLGYDMERPLSILGIKWCVPGDSSWEEFYLGAMAFGFPLGILLLFAAP